MGYVIYRVSTKGVRSRWWIVLLYLLIANAPDLDFIPGFLVGDPARYHHGISHSIGIALLVSVAFGLLLYIGGGVWNTRKFVISFCLYFSHVFLDCFSLDTSEPYGVPLFWPVSDEYYLAPLTFFLGVKRLYSSGPMFIPGLFSLQNLWAVCIELAVFVPIILLLLKLRRRSERLPE